MDPHEVSASAPAIWTVPLRAHSYDVDATRCATTPALCRYFLDAAWSHAEVLGVGFSQLAAQERVWVLSRLFIQFSRRPGWGESFTLRTWPRDTEGLFAMRDFEFLDGSNSRIAGGASAWLILNSRSRRPQRIEKLAAGIPVTADKATTRNPQKLQAEALDDPGEERTARPSDIDVNAHVTSARYLDWLLDTYPIEFQVGHMLREVEVNYLGETLAGDRLTVRSRETTPGQWHHEVLKIGGSAVCRAALKWQKSDRSNFSGIDT